MIRILINKINILLLSFEGVYIKMTAFDAVINIFAIAAIVFIKLYVVKLFA